VQKSFSAVAAACAATALLLAGCTGTVGSAAPRSARQLSTQPSGNAASTQAVPHRRPKRAPTRHRRRHRLDRTGATRQHRHHHTLRIAGEFAADLPNHRLTPGAARTVRAATVCIPGYASRVRDVPDSEKEHAYARYGVTHVPYQHEVDHLVSLELGGSNAITNLWPEPYAGRWGARTKDTLENDLHSLVCSGVLTLRHAQHVEATDWVAAYERYVGQPPTSAPPSPTHHRPRSSGGGCEPGYTPCLPRVADLDCGQIEDADKPIHVTGNDPYRLDADGDGLGCDT
jgi:5-methylcytosine-specific restriction endonuclease McrA